MPSRSKTLRLGLPRSILAAARRSFWLFMLFTHIGAVRSACTSLAQPSSDLDWGVSLGRVLLLAASTVFFLLKIVDVQCLRLKPGWHSWVAFTLVVALLHINVIQRASGRQLAVSPAGTAAAVVLGTFMERQALQHGLKRLLNRFLGAKKLLTGAAATLVAFRRFALQALFLPPPQHVFTNLLSPRPPPSC